MRKSFFQLTQTHNKVFNKKSDNPNYTIRNVNAFKRVTNLKRKTSDHPEAGIYCI